MEFAWLEDFITLADCGNFSRAAERRHISQPAFSRRVRMLEEWVGATLFNRDTHRVELTTAGECFRPVAEEVVRRIASGRDQARDAANSAAGALRFACTHVLSVTFFPEWLQQIEESRSLAAAVSLVTDHMAGCERLMLQGQAHFLLCHHHSAATTSLSSGYFQSIEVGGDLLVPVSAPNEDEKPLFELPGTIEQPLPLLAYSASSGMGRIIAATQAVDSPPAWLSPTFTAHVATVLLTMARSGRGIAWLPISLCEPHLERGQLVRAGSKDWDIPIQIRLIRPRARQSKVAEDFWAYLKDSLD